MLSVRFKADLSGLNAVEANVPRNAAKAVKNLADRVVEEIRASWSPESPSSPGSPPAIVTGTMDRSVMTEKQGRDVFGRFAGQDALSWAVRVNAVNKRGASYPRFLEYGTRKMEARPFLMDAAYRAFDDLPDEFKDVISTRVK
jgi:HK97 gp10 family phage protein